MAGLPPATLQALSNEQQLEIMNKVKAGMSIDEALALASKAAKASGGAAAASSGTSAGGAAGGPARPARPTAASFVSTVKAKVNRVQAAEGVCANCSRREQGGVSRACRVCNTTYCGSCKARFMTKSDAPGMRKRRRWICQSQQCQSKDPDRHLIVGASHAAGKSPAKPAAFSRPSSKPSSSASAKATAARINKSSSGGGNAPGRKMSLGAAAGTPKCAVCSKTVYALEQEKAKGQVFHRSCFTCGGCQKSLSGGIACELYDGRLYCASARGAGQSCLSQAKRQSSGGGGPEVLKGAVAGRSMDIECDADIKAIIECLGSDLEKAIDGMIPRCETCGSTFTAKQVIVIMGSIKKHKECFKAGKPMHKRDMTARQAVRFAPELLTLRLAVQGKAMTFFFVTDLEKSVDELGPTLFSIEYVPDKTAHTGTRRTCPPPDSSGHLKLGLEVAADESGFVVECRPYVRSDGEIVASLVHKKFDIHHQLRVVFHHDPAASKVEAMGATLTLSEKPIAPVAAGPGDGDSDGSLDSDESDDDDVSVSSSSSRASSRASSVASSVPSSPTKAVQPGRLPPQPSYAAPPPPVPAAVVRGSADGTGSENKEPRARRGRRQFKAPAPGEKEQEQEEKEEEEARGQAVEAMARATSTASAGPASAQPAAPARNRKRRAFKTDDTPVTEGAAGEATEEATDGAGGEATEATDDAASGGTDAGSLHADDTEDGDSSAPTTPSTPSAPSAKSRRKRHTFKTA